MKLSAKQFRHLEMIRRKLIEQDSYQRFFKVYELVDPGTQPSKVLFQYELEMNDCTLEQFVDSCEVYF